MEQFEYGKFIIDALDKAADIALQYYQKVSGISKADDNNQVLTKADLEIGQYLIDRVQEQYKDHNIIDEEIGALANNSDYTWVVDPIDGTSNFAAGVPTYGIMLGLLIGNTPIAGGIVLPSFNKRVYVAEKGKGAFQNGVALHVTEETSLRSTLLAYGVDSHQDLSDLTYMECTTLARIIQKIRNLRMSNSAFDIAMVLEGRYSGCMNRSSKIWDNVAQHILVEEAGGRYVDFKGNEISYSGALQRTKDNFEFIAIAPQFLEEVLEVVRTFNDSAQKTGQL